MSDSDGPPERPRWHDLDDEPGGEAVGEAPGEGESAPPRPTAVPPDDSPAPPRQTTDLWTPTAPPEPSEPRVPTESPTPPDDRPRPPGVEGGPGTPYIKLTRWNPYKKLTPEGRRFVQELVKFPAVTVGIIVTLVLFYAWMVAVGWELTFFLPSRWGYDLALAFGALEPDLVKAGEWWRLFTPALLHGSMLHLFVNSFMLYQLGRLAENVFGRLGLVVLFVGSAVTGCLASAFVGDHMSVGASGAVMGLVGANIAFGAMHRKRIPEFLRGLFGPTLIVYFGIIFFLGLLPGIDFWGHLGGAVGGAILGLILPSQIASGEPGEGPAPLRGPWLVIPAFALSVIVAVAALSFMIPRAVAYDGGIARDAIKDFDAAVEAERFEDAAAALDVATATEPDSPFIQGQRELLANHVMMAEDWRLSTQLMAQIEEEDPTFFEGRPSAQNNFAWSLFMSHPTDPERRARGLALATAALEKREDDPVVLNTLAWGLFLDGDYQGALGTIERAMKENKGRHLESDVYIFVAALHAVDRRDEALETYREAVTVHPGGVLHAEVAALLSNWGEGVDLTHEQVLDVVVEVSGVGEEAEGSELPLETDNEIDPEIEVETEVENEIENDPEIESGSSAPIPAAPDDDSAQDGWRPPRALYESSKESVQ